MAWYDWITGKAEENLATDIYHGVTGIPTEDEKRNTARLVNNQINVYKKQSELADSAIAQAKASQMAEKRKIDEKQLRAMRARFAPQGFLNSDADNFPDTLGA